MHGTRVLFVCGGNTCRSPMATGWATNLLPSEAVRFESAGLDTATGRPPDARAVLVMREMGVDISGHRTRDVAKVPLGEFDHVVALRPYMKGHLLKLDPSCLSRLQVWDVADPYCAGSLDAYRQCATLLRTLVAGLVASCLRGTNDDQ